MDVTLSELDAAGRDRDALIDFLTGDEFPFHVIARPSSERVSADIENGRWGDHDHRAFWLHAGGLGRSGLAALSDVADDAPLVDLRLGSAFRSRGLGAPSLRALVDEVFSGMPGVLRLEGNTRVDNIAMRRVFTATGFVLEARYRDGWPIVGGAPIDSVGYAILRRDWVSGTATPVDWDDVDG